MHNLSGLNSTYIISVSVEQESACCLAGSLLGSQRAAIKERVGLHSHPDAGQGRNPLLSSFRLLAEFPSVLLFDWGLWFLEGWRLPTWASPTQQLTCQASKETLSPVHPKS